VILWRIGADTPRYTADDMTGTGAARFGGRWNPPGVPLVYASESRALACLETLVHFDGADFPFNRYLVRIDVPGDIWAAARREPDPPVGWDAEPAGMTSIRLGAQWARAGDTCLLVIPSAIVPEEHNILINPAHADTSRLVATKIRRWLYDPRLQA
jgi:RES domain-containing protein